MADTDVLDAAVTPRPADPPKGSGAGPARAVSAVAIPVVASPPKVTPAGPADLGAELSDIAVRIQEVDVKSAQRVRTLADSLAHDDYGSQSTLDLTAAINPESIENSAFDIYQRRPVLINIVEWARNVLVLAPLCLTWLGLWKATANYKQLLDLDPSRIGEPFLLLWERGFAGLPGASGLKFSQVALLDFLLLLLVLALTLVVHRWRDVLVPRADKMARTLRTDLEDVLGRVEKLLAEARHSQTQEAVAAELIKSLRDELATVQDQLGHLRDAAGSRVKEIEDLSSLGNRLAAGAAELSKFSAGLGSAYEPLRESVGTLSGHVQSMGDHQAELVGSMGNVSRQLVTLTTSVSTAVAELKSTATAMAASADKMGTYSQTTAVNSGTVRDVFRDMSVGLDAVAKNLRATTGDASGLTTKLGAAATSLDTIMGRLGDVAGRLTETSASFGQTARELRAVGEGMAPVAREFPQQIARLSADLEGSVTALRSASGKLETSAGQVTRLIDSSTQSLNGLLGGFGALAGQMKDMTGDLQKATYQAGEYAQAIQRAVDALTHTVDAFQPVLDGFGKRADEFYQRAEHSNRQLSAVLRRMENAERLPPKKSAIEWAVLGTGVFLLAVLTFFVAASALGIIG